MSGHFDEISFQKNRVLVNKLYFLHNNSYLHQLLNRSHSNLKVEISTIVSPYTNTQRIKIKLYIWINRDMGLQYAENTNFRIFKIS